MIVEDGEFYWESEYSFKLNEKATSNVTLPKSKDKALLFVSPLIIKNINFAANKGEFISVIGEIGSSKSSFAHVL